VRAAEQGLSLRLARYLGVRALSASESSFVFVARHKSGASLAILRTDVAVDMIAKIAVHGDVGLFFFPPFSIIAALSPPASSRHFRHSTHTYSTSLASDFDFIFKYSSSHRPPSPPAHRPPPIHFRLPFPLCCCQPLLSTAPPLSTCRQYQ